MRISCKHCGGDIGDVITCMDGSLAIKCRNCGIERPRKSRRMSDKKKAENDRLNETLQSLLGPVKSPCANIAT